MQKKHMAPTMTGIAAATLAAGTAAYIMSTNRGLRQRRKIKKTAGKAAQAIEGAVNDVVDSVTSNLLR